MTQIKDRLAGLLAYFFNQDRKANPLPLEKKKKLQTQTEMKLEEMNASGAQHDESKGENNHDGT
jgi:hypothetical protein